MAVTAFKATNEAPTTFKLVVPKEHARMRLDLFLVQSLPELSRSRVQQLIRAGFVRRNGGIWLRSAIPVSALGRPVKVQFRLRIIQPGILGNM